MHQTQTVLSIRRNPGNLNHHMWDNNGVWWCHYTLHQGPCKLRRRCSLHTSDVELARTRRDAILNCCSEAA